MATCTCTPASMRSGFMNMPPPMPNMPPHKPATNAMPGNTVKARCLVISPWSCPGTHPISCSEYYLQHQTVCNETWKFPVLVRQEDSKTMRWTFDFTQPVTKEILWQNHWWLRRVFGWFQAQRFIDRCSPVYRRSTECAGKLSTAWRNTPMVSASMSAASIRRHSSSEAKYPEKDANLQSSAWQTTTYDFRTVKTRQRSQRIWLAKKNLLYLSCFAASKQLNYKKRHPHKSKTHDFAPQTRRLQGSLHRSQ